jgi:glyoxylase-like metal-dependent hydrolase (beta-lactamase superfamily II)
VDELAGGIRRVTLPLPQRPGHVHAYVLPGDDGWTVVDTGLGLPDATERWGAELAGLPGGIARVFVTHFHPDHVGAAADLAALTGAAVHQGALDAAQCRSVWGSADWPERIAAWFVRHGVPGGLADDLVEQGRLYAPFIRPAREAVALGREIAGWTVVATPGHADGHVCLLRDGVLVVGDHVLSDISPAIGLYPGGRPDPLADYLESLRLVERLAPRVALPGHGDPIAEPARRASELVDHHAERLDATAAALDASPRSAHEVSFPLFGDDLPPAARRFAVAEALSHLERLVGAGRARRSESDGTVRYSAA